MDPEVFYQQGVLNRIDRAFADMIQRINGEEDPLVAMAAGLVSRAASEGHVCLDLESVVRDGIQGNDPDRRIKVNVSLGRWREALTHARVVGGENEKKPMIMVGNLVYLQRYWKYESFVAREILLRCQSRPKTNPLLEKYTLKNGRLKDQQQDPDQTRAVRAALCNRFTVISGGPGTGKTTTIARIIVEMHRLAKGRVPRIMLAAPTGKAAARMQEALHRCMVRLEQDERADMLKGIIEAKTLHRLLGIGPGRKLGRYTFQDPLPADVIIIDEASMIDLALMAKLVGALSSDTRLILVGDKDQLASVEAGSVMGDICAGVTTGEKKDSESSAEVDQRVELSNHIVVLSKSYRFAEDSGIDALGRAINSGNARKAIDLLDDPGKGSISFKSIDGFQDVDRELGRAVMMSLAPVFRIDNPAQALRALEKLKILTPVRQGPFGVTSINQLVENTLRQHQVISLEPGSGAQWYHGRPVMMNRNDYFHNLFNGDVGIAVVEKSAGMRQVHVMFPDGRGSTRHLVPEQLPDHQTVYAMTVHKSQGTEFQTVLLILPDRDLPLLTRELIYTAVTRARHSVEIWGRREILAAAIERRIHRASGLRKQLWPSP